MKPFHCSRPLLKPIQRLTVWLSYLDALIKDKKHDGARQVLDQAKQQGIAIEKLQVFEGQLPTKVQASGSASPSKEQLDRLLDHYQRGRFVEAEKLAATLTGDFPNHPFSWKVLGAILGQAGRNAEAVVANQKGGWSYLPRCGSTQ